MQYTKFAELSNENYKYWIEQAKGMILRGYMRGSVEDVAEMMYSAMARTNQIGDTNGTDTI